MRIQPVNGDVGVCPRHVCHFISVPFNIAMPLRAISWGLILKPKRSKEADYIGPSDVLRHLSIT